jgi:hypothetical protein
MVATGVTWLKLTVLAPARRQEAQRVVVTGFFK